VATTAPAVQEVHVPALPPERFKGLLAESAYARFEQGIDRARELLDGRVVWNLNSTAAGGGVAEMLRPFVAYSRGARIDMRWGVIAGDAEFFAITKRIHNFLHGDSGDGGALGSREGEVYRAVAERNAASLIEVVRPEDVLVLHDPQTAGMVPRLKSTGATVVWRCHIGAEHPNEHVEQGWSFLRPHAEQADVCIFSRRAYVPAWATRIRTDIIQPSIDAFSPKNQDLEPAAQRAILGQSGLVRVDEPSGALPMFERLDGSRGRVDRQAAITSQAGAPGLDDPLVVQVSRWDRLKDPAGVMLGFARHVPAGVGAHLMLAGPEVQGVADDPEGAQVLREVEDRWRALPDATRAKIHLARLPMADIDENAAMVNALQRHATVIVQKSLKEGFGLTVAEGMWKTRPVVASAVGGINDQIVDGGNGVLLEDPADLEAFGAAVTALLRAPERARELGTAAKTHVCSHFLVDRHALQYVALFEALLPNGGQPRADT
jgi:trehalose synthase